MAPKATDLEAAALEALRAAALAAHHAAGLCRSAKLFSAARTARTGEALLRSSVALARAPAPVQPAAPARPAQPEQGKTEPRPSAEVARRRHRKRKTMSVDQVPDAQQQRPLAELDDSWADSVVRGPKPSVETSAATATSSHPGSGSGRRELKQRISRERTPPPTSRVHFAIGERVIVQGLEKRIELNGLHGKIIDLGSDGRLGVQLASSECIRVKEPNLSFQGTGIFRSDSSKHV